MKFSILVVIATSLLALSADAQQDKRPLSPRDSVFCLIDTNKISVNYGRPSMRGRKIMGELVPWNAVWRTGANEATHFKTNFDMMIGGVPLTRGTYTLWTLPSPKGWKFIINKQTKQWGTRYDESQDYARFDAIVEEMETPVETLTIAFDATGNTHGRLKLMWENTMVWTRFEKNTNIRPLSPLDSAEVLLGENKVKVKFSKPYIRGRSIWGTVVPFDSIWRTGANAATVLETETPLVVGGAKIPAGVYTLYSKLNPSSLELIISKKEPGNAVYDPTQDVARISLQMRKSAKPIDPMQISFDQGSQKNSAIMKIGWSDREYLVDLSKQ